MISTRDSAEAGKMTTPGNDWIAWNDAMSDEDVFRNALKPPAGDEHPSRRVPVAGAGITVAYIHESANWDDYRACWERERIGLLARERNVVIRATFIDKVQYDHKNGFVEMLHSIRQRPVQLVLIPSLQHLRHLRSADKAVRILRERFGAEVVGVEPG
ncbi:hypothetical protein [Kribbella deserti]|uniref:Resolvase/invertase-type recombinase catalytic domain-containing protein n=1 Tax=Kribbella deserti TaxID=1926257 RepID=A0ABV6QUI1_9ACTN